MFLFKKAIGFIAKGIRTRQAFTLAFSNKPGLLPSRCFENKESDLFVSNKLMLNEISRLLIWNYARLVDLESKHVQLFWF